MDASEKRAEALTAHIKGWEKKIDELVASMKDAKDEQKSSFHTQIDHLKTQIVVAQTKLEEFKKAGESKWDHFKLDIEKAWHHVEKAFTNLKQ